MPEVTSYEPGTFCWVELATTDPKKAKSFYASLFAWSPIGMSLTSHTRTMMSLSPTPTPHAAKAKSLGARWSRGELMTSDIEAARKFYSGLLGWKYKVSPEYTEIEVGGRSTAGMMPIRPEMNFAVEDTDATAKKVQSGGRIP